jgi:hypothetical protein
VKEHCHDEKVVVEEENEAISIMTDALLKYGDMGNSRKKMIQDVLLL